MFFINFLDILYNCFITLLFLFSRDADLRKGTLCPFCIPIHKKKKKVASFLCWREISRDLFFFFFFFFFFFLKTLNFFSYMSEKTEKSSQK